MRFGQTKNLGDSVPTESHNEMKINNKSSSFNWNSIDDNKYITNPCYDFHPANIHSNDSMF